jgi:hypothetical protein
MINAAWGSGFEKKTVFEDRDGNVSYSKKTAEPEDHLSSFLKRRDKTEISNFKF